VREAVLEGAPRAQQRTVVVDMSSPIRPPRAALGTALARRGVELVDAPVSGAVPKAIDGTLTHHGGRHRGRHGPRASGAGEARQPHRPRRAARRRSRGESADNYVGAAGTLAGFEALLIARAYGLESESRCWRRSTASTGRNSTTERKIPQQVLTGPSPPGSGSR